MELEKQLCVNASKQKKINELKSVSTSINKTEDILHEKIKQRYQELSELKKEYTNMIETYNHIIKSSNINIVNNNH